MTMIKPKLTLFKMKIKVWFMNASKLGQPGLGDAPEVLDAVDVVRSVRKFVFAMMDAIMLLVAKIHETVIGLESVPTRFRIIGTSSFTEQFLTTCVYTFPFRLISPKTTVFPPAPRPLTPRTRRAPK